MKKDDVIRAFARRRFGAGKEWRGYVPFRGFGDQDVNMEMNREVRELIDTVRVVILEGGTRTRRQLAVTLAGVQGVANCRIVKLSVSLREVLRRLAKRRHLTERIDDLLPLALLKLAGQYIRPLLTRSPRAGDEDVEVIDANQDHEQVTRAVERIVRREVWPTQTP